MKRPALVFLLSLLVGFMAVGVAIIQSPSDTEASVSDYTLTEITSFFANSGRVDWSADGNWIAYDYKEGDGYWDVYQIHPDGSGNECLTCDQPGLPNRHQGQPAYHPDGRYLVFQAEKASHGWAGFGLTQPGAGVYNDLWVLDFDTGNFYQLTGVRSWYPAGGSLHSHFSRDGSQLLWGDLERGAGCFGDWRLATADFITTPEPHLENITYYQPGDETKWYESQDWSLDGTGIYFACAPLAGQDDRAADFCYMDLATQGLTRLTQTSGLNDEPAEWEEHGKISPLGDAIVWMSSQGHGINTESCNYYNWLRTELWMMNLDGTGKTKLTHFNDPGYPEYDAGGAIVSDHSWSPDGTKIAALVYYNSTGKTELKILHLTHGPLPMPTPTEEPTPTPTATPTPADTPTPPPSPTETVEFYDSFEDGTLGKWVQDSQNDWFVSTQRATDGLRSAEVDGRATDAVLSLANSIDLTGKTSASLTFSWLIEKGLDRGEYLCLDLYSGSWQEYKCLDGNVDAENTWHDENVDLSAYLVTNFEIRFRAKMSRSREDANLDSVKIVSVN